MTQRAALFAAMSSFVLVAGCAGSPNTAYLHMPPSARDHVASTDVVMPIKQNEIYMVVQSSQAVASQFGLVGALVGAGIDASNANSAETALQPVRTSLADFSFDNVLQSDLKTALGREAWLHPANFSVVKEVTPQKLESLVADAKSSAVMLVTADYQLSNDADKLTVTLSPCLYPVSPELKAMLAAPKPNPKMRPDNSLYCNTLIYRDVVPRAVADRDGNLALWAADNGGAMRASLQKASGRLSEMLAAGLESSPAADPAKSGLARKTVDLPPGYSVAGYVVSSDEGGSYLLFDGGRQMYVTKAAMTYEKPHKQTAVEQAREQKEQERAARAAAKGS